VTKNEKFCDFGKPDEFEAIRSVTMWYEMLEEDLVGESEEVECPKCGEKCSGRESYTQHFGQAKKHGNPERNLPPGYEYIRENQIHQKIASQTPFGVDTVRRLVRIGKLPEETLWLIEENESYK